MRRATTLGLLVGLLVACSAASDASVSPAPDPSGRVLSAGPSLQTPAASSATSASIAHPSAAPTTIAPQAVAFEWGEPVALSGLEDWPFDQPLLAYSRGAFVAAQESRIWVSADARRWDVADSPVDENALIEIHDLVAGQAGFLAVGTEEIDADDDGNPEDSRAVVLTSSDGHRWVRVSDPRFEHAGMNLVAMSRQGVVAFGYILGGVGASIWTSADGHGWLKATNPTGLHVAKGVQVITESDGGLTAFATLPGPTVDASGPVEVWQTEGRADWEKVGELPDPSGAYVRNAAFGGGRWFALGEQKIASGVYESRAWSSSDGVTWIHDMIPGNPSVEAIAGWAGGLIAAGSTGSAPGETCGGSEPWVGRTWLSTGTTWQALPPTAGAAITALVIANDRIVGIGPAIGADGGANGNTDLVQWSATLPASPSPPTPEPTPTPTPTPTPSRDSCGS